MNSRTLAASILTCVLISHCMLGQADRWNQLTAEVNQLYASGKPSEAIPVAKEAIDVARKTFGAQHVNYGLSLNNLALAYAAVSKYSDAETEYKKAIEVLEKCDCSEVARPLSNLAALYATQGHYPEAETFASRAVDVSERTFGAQSANTAAAKEVLGQIYLGAGRFVDAEQSYKQALAIQQQALPAGNVEIGRTYGNLGFLYQSEGNRGAAKNMYEQALTILENALPSGDPLVTMTRNYLAQVSSAAPVTDVNGSSTSTLFQQCMDYKVNLCMADCVGNYHFKESQCRKELCSLTPNKFGDNRSLWTEYCQRRVARELDRSR